MLRVTQQDNAAAAKSYYSKADYYTDGQEIVGRWGGRAAGRLGLAGVVDPGQDRGARDRCQESGRLGAGQCHPSQFRGEVRPM